MVNGEIGYRESNPVVIPEAFIIDQPNNTNSAYVDLPELRLPEEFYGSYRNTVPYEKSLVIIIDI